MGNKLTKKITSVLLSATTAVLLSSSALVMPIANAQTTDLQAQINALLSQIAALQAQLAAQSGTAVATACTFTRDLTVGAKGDDVKCLQQYLNGKGYKVAESGVGSPGNETTYFGSLTKAAAAKWQAANSVSPAVGYFGSISRAKYTSLAGAAPVVTPVTPAPVAGVASGLTVTLAPNQPASGLFGESFASRDFTKLNFTASADGDVTVKALTVQRTGQGNDSAFSGVVLLDESGVRLGDAKTFGSTHTTRMPDKFIVKAGQTRTITLGGDSDADQNDYNGQLVSLTLTNVEVEGATNVNVSYPLTGPLMTVNSTLAIGSATLARGPLDPGNGTTKEIGTQGYIFSALQITAGTNEDVTIKSIKWNQSGSAAIADLGNIKTTFDGVIYDTEVSSDGKYYTAKFGGGITITKGNNKELYIKGNVLSGSNRTVDFDLYRYAEIQVVGNTYGYTILPSATETTADNDDDGEFQDAQPRWDAFQVNIGNGSITAEKATEVAAQNVSENLSDQSLGGILIDIKGESITVAAMNFDVALTKAASGVTIDTNDITNITLVQKSTGKVVAGPVDGVAGYNSAVRFTDTVTFPVGRTVYELKGKLGTDFSQNDLIAASTTPSSDWTTVRGVDSGQTITPAPASAVTLSTMTVKAGALTLTLASDTSSSSPNQNVVAGTNAYPFAKYVLDASGSGEDLRITSMQLDITTSYPANTADELTNCQLFDGSTPLNAGTNVVNPTNTDAAGVDKTFSFDTGLIIPKGTVKTLTLKCNLIAGGTSEFVGWGLGNLTTAANAAVVTGVVSGTAIAETTTTNNGRTIIPQSAGTLTLALDSSSPSVKLVQAGATDQTLAILRLNALYEDVQLNEIGLQIATSSADSPQANASNSPSDLTKVTLWDGATKVGEATFTNDYATATLSNFVVGKDTQKLLTVKADIAPIDVTLSQAVPGHLIIVNYDSKWGDSAVAGTEGAQGSKSKGLASGSTIYTAGSDTSSNGARIVKAIPSIEKVSTSGKFTNTSDQILYRFKISAPAGTNGIGLYKFTFNVSTNTTSVTEISGGGVEPSHTFKVTNYRVYCYSDSAFNNGSCGNSSGQLNFGGLLIADGNAGNRDYGASGGDGTNTTADSDVDVPVLFNPAVGSGSTAEAIRIPAGETRWFELKADVTGASSTPSIATKLNGDPEWQGIPCKESADQASGTSGGVVAACDYRFADTNSGATTFTATAALLDGDNGLEEDFIWSDNATNTSQAIASWDWMNGYLIPGLPTSATASEVVTF